MTALAAFWRYDDTAPGGDAVRRMLSAQALYGRDARHQLDLGGVALGRCLMRRLPEDRHDRQPIDDGRFVMVADVRLDDRAGLAATLGIDSVEAARLSDSAILMKAWQRWGETLFDHVYGDCAFALWDRETRMLVLARDAMGEVPLHYHLGDGFVAVASMPKGLHALDDVPRAPDLTRTIDHLALLGDSGPSSFFAGIARVELGTIVKITEHGITSASHWHPRLKRNRFVPGTDYAGQLRAHLDRAVATRLRGAGAVVATHLSAGFDSSAVTTSAALAMAATGGRVVAFTAAPRAGYDGPEPLGGNGHEDRIAAETVALYDNIDHVVVRPDARQAIDRFDQYFHLFDRPISAPPNHRWISAIDDAVQARGITVLLTGIKGNATISYNGDEFLSELAAAGRWWRLWHVGRAAVKTGRTRWRGVLAQALGPKLPRRVWRLVSRLATKPPVETSAYSALRPERYDELDLNARLSAAGQDMSYRPIASAATAQMRMCQRADPAYFRKGVLAGWGIDTRDPTADRALLEFCLTLPMEAYRAGGEARGLARAAFGDRIAPAVSAARTRGTQALDWHEGLTESREDYRREIERLANVPEAAALLDLPRMQALLDDWPEGGWTDAATIHSYRYLLMRGTAVGHFLRRATGSNA